MDCWKYCKRYKFVLSVARPRAKKLSVSRGLRPPDPLTRGSAPGPRWELCPQTPVIGSLSTRSPCAPQKLSMAPIVPVLWRRRWWGIKISRFSTNKSLYLANDARYRHANFFSHIKTDQDIKQLQCEVVNFKNWMDTWLLKLNVNKCKSVSYGRCIEYASEYNIWYSYWQSG